MDSTYSSDRSDKQRLNGIWIAEYGTNTLLCYAKLLMVSMSWLEQFIHHCIELKRQTPSANYIAVEANAFMHQRPYISGDNVFLCRFHQWGLSGKSKLHISCQSRFDDTNLSDNYKTPSMGYFISGEDTQHFFIPIHRKACMRSMMYSSNREEPVKTRQPEKKVGKSPRKCGMPHTTYEVYTKPNKHKEHNIQQCCQRKTSLHVQRARLPLANSCGEQKLANDKSEYSFAKPTSMWSVSKK